jgi:hypothetical protein
MALKANLIAGLYVYLCDRFDKRILKTLHRNSHFIIVNNYTSPTKKKYIINTQQNRNQFVL